MIGKELKKQNKVTMNKKYLFLTLLITSLCLPANSAQQYIQKVHEQQKLQAAHKTQVNKAANTSKPNKKEQEPVYYGTILPVVNSDCEKYYQEALKQIDENNLYVAQTNLSKALEINHDFVKAIKKRGFVRNRLGNYNGAIQDFNNAITLDSSDGDLFYGRGFAKLALQNYPEAVNDFAKAIKLNPNDLEAYHQRGYAYSLWGKSTGTQMLFDNAIWNFNKVLSSNPNYTEARLYRGMALCEQGKKETGLKDIQEAMTEYKNSGDNAAYQRSVQIYNWIKQDY